MQRERAEKVQRTIGRETSLENGKERIGGRHEKRKDKEGTQRKRDRLERQI